MKKSTREIGNIGETAVEKYLTRRGWRILSNNFSVRGGEIDMIGYRFGTLAYFEVKSRSNDLYGRPAEAVDARKLSNIRYAKSVFESMYVHSGKIEVFYPLGISKKRNIYRKRIDIVEVYFGKDYKVEKINHIKDVEEL